MVLIYSSDRDLGIFLPKSIIDDSAYVRQLITNGTDIRIPYLYGTVLLLHKPIDELDNHGNNRIRIVECCQVINILHVLRSETLIYQAASRLLDIISKGGDNRIHGTPRRVIVDHPELSVRAVLLGVIDKSKPSQIRTTVNMKEFLDYVNDSSVKFSDVIRLNIDIEQTIEALNYMAQIRDRKFSLASYLVDNNYLELISYTLDNGYDFMLLPSVL